MSCILSPSLCAYTPNITTMSSVGTAARNKKSIAEVRYKVRCIDAEVRRFRLIKGHHQIIYETIDELIE